MSICTISSSTQKTPLLKPTEPRCLELEGLKSEEFNQKGSFFGLKLKETKQAINNLLQTREKTQSSHPMTLTTSQPLQTSKGFQAITTPITNTDINQILKEYSQQIHELQSITHLNSMYIRHQQASEFQLKYEMENENQSVQYNQPPSQQGVFIPSDVVSGCQLEDRIQAPLGNLQTDQVDSAAFADNVLSDNRNAQVEVEPQLSYISPENNIADVKQESQNHLIQSPELPDSSQQLQSHQVFIQEPQQLAGLRSQLETQSSQLADLEKRFSELESKFHFQSLLTQQLWWIIGQQSFQSNFLPNRFSPQATNNSNNTQLLPQPTQQQQQQQTNQQQANGSPDQMPLNSGINQVSYRPTNNPNPLALIEIRPSPSLQAENLIANALLPPYDISVDSQQEIQEIQKLLTDRKLVSVVQSISSRKIFLVYPRRIKSTIDQCINQFNNKQIQASYFKKVDSSPSTFAINEYITAIKFGKLCRKTKIVNWLNHCLQVASQSQQADQLLLANTNQFIASHFYINTPTQEKKSSQVNPNPNPAS